LDGFAGSVREFPAPACLRIQYFSCRSVSPSRASLEAFGSVHRSRFVAGDGGVVDLNMKKVFTQVD
jgi:hypothetical protein